MTPTHTQARGGKRQSGRSANGRLRTAADAISQPLPRTDCEHQQAAGFPEAERQQVVREHAAAERAARQVAADQARALEQAAERARQAVACTDCGTPRAAGLCEACGNRRVAAEQLHEAALLAAAHRLAVDNRQDVAAVVAWAEGAGRAEVAAAAQLHGQGAVEGTLACMSG